MATLYISYYEKHYKASWCSCTALTLLLIYLFACIAPFLICYYTNGKYLLVF